MNQGVRAARQKSTGLQQQERELSTARVVSHALSPLPETLVGYRLALARRAVAGRFSLAQNDNRKDRQGDRFSLMCGVVPIRSEMREEIAETSINVPGATLTLP